MYKIDFKLGKEDGDREGKLREPYGWMKTLTNHNTGKLHCELIRPQTIGED